jgi:hypothetical protein
MDVRPAFLAAAGDAHTALQQPEVGRRWEEPSALDDLAIGSLAAHLARGVLLVERYLDHSDRISESEPVLSPAAYLAALLEQGSTGHEGPFNRGVRQRAAEDARAGFEATHTAVASCISRLQQRLAREPRDRLVSVFQGMVTTLDGYLATRIIELTVHTDDLYVSLALPTPALSSMEAAIPTLVDVARLRHGDLAVLRALARRERDVVSALRVI